MTRKLIVVLICAFVYVVLFFLLFNLNFSTSRNQKATLNNALLLISSILLVQFHSVSILLYFEQHKARVNM